MNHQIRILRGISCSGKSTFANECEASGSKVISRDRIRVELLGKYGFNINAYFAQGMDFFIEEEVTKIERQSLASLLALEEPQQIIIDNTNLKPAYIQQYVNMFYEFDVDPDNVEIIEFEIDLATALARQSEREVKIADEVIKTQLDAFNGNRESCSLGNFIKFVDGHAVWKARKVSFKRIREKEYTKQHWVLPAFYVDKYIPNFELPPALICDLDGTLAHRKIFYDGTIRMRSYHDYKSVRTDGMDELVLNIVKCLQSLGVEIIFLSGRPETDDEGNDIRYETEEWLKSIGLSGTLFMREVNMVYPETNKKWRDDKVKYELFKEITKKYRIIGAIDDRKRVCALWEALGLRVLNVGLINEEF